jgi:two-component system chemotaxis sensor kinase CheA
MVPLGTVFGRFRRVCRELEERLGKRVTLRISGEETELDKGMVERLVDPLTHVLRNSLDHGVESPEQREAAGKSPVAIVSLSASHQGGEVVIEVSDDGRGLDRDAILARARERGLPIGENPSDEEVWALIFEAGFSTAQSVTDVSGRGVGMDVVRRNVAELGGRVELRSAAGKGTTIRIRLPLTLAILDGLAVRIGGEVYIIPLTAIIESLVPASGSRLRIGAGEVLAFRGDYVPIIPLRERFSEGTAPPNDDVICVVVESGSRRAALEVDALEEQLQAVVKSLEANYRAVPGMAGATVLGNGRVALILDIPGLLGTIT